MTTDFSGRGDGALALAIQSDGRIVAGGSTRNLYDNDFALARYNRNGSLDTTFGTAGKITTDVSGSGDAIYAIAIQADGKIIAAGEMRANPGPDSSPNGAIVRYNSDGSVDTGFGIDGRVTTDLPNGSTAMHAVAIQADGKIIAAEHSPAVTGRRTIGGCLSGTTLMVRWTRLLETGKSYNRRFRSLLHSCLSSPIERKNYRGRRFGRSLQHRRFARYHLYRRRKAFQTSAVFGVDLSLR